MANFDWYLWLSFSIAVATNIGSIIAAVIMGWWYFYRLRHSKSHLRPLIGSIALAKLNLWFWSGAAMWAMTFGYTFPPVSTLPARILWLIVVLIQVWVTIRIRPAPKDEEEDFRNDK